MYLDRGGRRGGGNVLDIGRDDPPSGAVGRARARGRLQRLRLGRLDLGWHGRPRPPQLATVDVDPERPPHALDAREVLLRLRSRPLLELVGRQPLVRQLQKGSSVKFGELLSN